MFPVFIEAHISLPSRPPYVKVTVVDVIADVGDKYDSGPIVQIRYDGGGLRRISHGESLLCAVWLKTGDFDFIHKPSG